jgi:putative cardiolipin synthase
MTLFGSSGASLHTKAFTVDDYTGFIGSFNFDPRSVSLNTDMGVLFRQSDLVREMKDLFVQETAPRTSYRLELSPGGSLSWVSEAEGKREVLDHEPETNLWRRLLTKMVGLLPIQSQL